MDMTMIPPWMSNLDDEDMTFIKRFLLASGSMKEVAAQYGVSYPTVRLRLDRLIQKIQLGEQIENEPYIALIKRLAVDDKLDFDPANTDIGSTIFANMPGDGSAREQAASCQRVMGASANFAKQYATKRYRSNCINWGMTPFLVENPEVFELGDYIFVPGIREAVLENKASFSAYAVKPDGTVTEFPVSTGALTEAERQIIADGCLINYYRNNQ